MRVQVAHRRGGGRLCGAWNGPAGRSAARASRAERRRLRLGLHLPGLGYRAALQRNTAFTATSNTRRIDERLQTASRWVWRAAPTGPRPPGLTRSLLHTPSLQLAAVLIRRPLPGLTRRACTRLVPLAARKKAAASACFFARSVWAGAAGSGRGHTAFQEPYPLPALPPSCLFHKFVCFFSALSCPCPAVQIADPASSSNPSVPE